MDKDIPTHVPRVRHMDIYKPTNHHTHSTHSHTWIDMCIHTTTYYMKIYIHARSHMAIKQRHTMYIATYIQIHTDSSTHTHTINLDIHVANYTLADDTQSRVQCHKYTFRHTDISMKTQHAYTSKQHTCTYMHT